MSDLPQSQNVFAPQEVQPAAQALPKKRKNEEEGSESSTTRPLKTIKLEPNPEAVEEVDSDLNETREIREVEILPLLDTQRFLRFEFKEWDEAQVEQFIKLFLINPDHKSLVVKLTELKLNGAALEFICEGKAEEYGLDENERFVLIQHLDGIEKVVTDNKLNIAQEVDSDLDEVREPREVELLSLLKTQRFLCFDFKEWDEAEVEQFIKLFLMNPDHESLVLKLRELKLNGAALYFICEGEAEELGLDENDTSILIPLLKDIERIVTKNNRNIPPLFDPQEVQPAAQEEVDSDLDGVREIGEAEILTLLDTQRFLRLEFKEWDKAEVEQFIKLFLINPDLESLVFKLGELQLNGAALHCICEGEAEEFGLDENDRFVLIQQLDGIERVVTENKLNIAPLLG